MRSLAAVLMSLSLSAAAVAQSKPSAAIPATEPTSVSNLPSARPGATGAPRGGSRVTWDGSALTIQAGGDSLRSVLGQVARSTGMKVTGGVPDGPVYGTYGPGPAQQVLSALFDGLYVNMMLVNGSPTKPKELILTARSGGPTPPSPAQPLSAAEYTHPTFSQPVQVQPVQVQADRAGRRTPPNGFGQPPTDQQQQPLVPGLPEPAQGTPVLPVTAVQENGVSTANGVTTDANGTPVSPNGTSTPEQIFQELRRRQQSQQGQQGSAPTQ